MEPSASELSAHYERVLRHVRSALHVGPLGQLIELVLALRCEAAVTGAPVCTASPSLCGLEARSKGCHEIGGPILGRGRLRRFPALPLGSDDLAESVTVCVVVLFRLKGARVALDQLGSHFELAL